MDHEEVIRQKMTERYLLDELDANTRDEFEEHFFDCPDCAHDVKAGSIFVEHSKVVLAEEGEQAAVPLPARVPVAPRPLAWLRPALVVPALAVLLVIVAYQNLVTYPKLREAHNRPLVLPWASINTGTRGGSRPVISVPPGGGFLLFVNIPADNRYSHYIADLYNPAGKLEWSLTIPATSADDSWPVHVPGTDREGGTYTLAVQGVTSGTESQEISHTSFELQIQR